MSSPLVGRPNARSCLCGREGMSRYLGPKGKETTMPELLIDFITSLDGYAAAEGWPGWWGLEGPEYLAWLGEQAEEDYTGLMGANNSPSGGGGGGGGRARPRCPGGHVDGRLLDHAQRAPFLGEHAARGRRP